VALAVLAASAFALSIQDGHWWSMGEVTIGPFGAHHCFGGDCRATGLAWIGASEFWMRTAIATGSAGLLAAGLLVLVGAGAAAGRVPRLVARMALVAVATAAVAGGYFFTAFPGIGPAHAAVGRGVLLFALAIPLGAAAGLLVVRAARGRRM
jgi:hypothetical protein